MGKLTEHQFHLLEKNIIELQDEVNEEMLAYVRESMVELSLKDNPPIQINIMSNGGITEISFVIYDMLRLYAGKKTGTVIGFARSAATTILQACDKREAYPSSFILIHNPKIGDGVIGLDEIEDPIKWDKIVRRMRETQEKLHLILEKKTKGKQGVIAALCKEDRDLSAEEALAFGLIDEIL